MCVTLFSFSWAWLFVSFHHLFQVDGWKHSSQAFGGFGPNKAKDADTHRHTHTHTHTKGQLNSASLGGNAITRGLSYRHKTHTHTEPGALSLAGHCIVGLCGQSLHEWLSSVFLDQVFDDECVFDHQASARGSLRPLSMHVRTSARRRIFPYVCMRLCILWCVWYMWTRVFLCAFALLWWAPVDCVPLNEAAYSCPCLWETIVGPAQWRDACLGKGCKVMGKGSFVSAGSWGSESWADVFIA